MGVAGTTGGGGQAGQAGPNAGAAGAGAAGMGVGGSAGSVIGGTGASGANGQTWYCTFDTDFTFTTAAGLTGWINLAGDLSLSIPGIVCTSWHTFTYCGAPGLDIYDIAADVQHPDVQQGLSIGLYAAVYGDPAAGNPWRFGRGPNEMMTVYRGTDCAPGQCKPIPPGIARLIDDLDQMVAALLDRPDCTL